MNNLSFKPRSKLNLPEENPLIAAIKKRIAEFRTELNTMFGLFDARFRTEKQRIDAKLREADEILKDAKGLKDGEDGLDGRDGVDGTDGLPGHDGVDGKDGADGKDGVDGLPGKDGIDGLNGKPGNDGKDGREITPEQWKEKGKELPVKEAWFDARHILGLTDFIRNLTQGIKLGGGGGGSVEFFTISGTVDGSNTTFTLPKPFTNPVICYNGQILDPQAHYSISGTTLTLTTAPNSGTLFGFGQPA